MGKDKKIVERKNNTHLVCPFCGWVNYDSFECGLYNHGDEKDFECPSCDRVFLGRVEFTILYSTKGL